LVTLKNLDLVAKNGHLKLQVDASSEAGKKAAEDGNDDLAHDLTLRGMDPNSEDFWAGWDLWKGQHRSDDRDGVDHARTEAIKPDKRQAIRIGQL
jgi:hypothetical protein